MEIRLARLEDLEGILALQAENHRDIASDAADGFVTVRHRRSDLEAMHTLAPSVVGVDDSGQVLGYAIVMLAETRALVPVLGPMFARLDTLGLGRYYVMGQVCVAARARGTGVFAALYDGHARHYGDAFDHVVTEIATRNTRSMRAHEKVGFRVVDRYEDETDAWAIVARPASATR